MQGVVVIDEAAFHEYLAEVLKAALALTMWGAKVRIISTHNGSENLFNELITDSRAGRKRYSVHTITIEDACRDGLYQRICQVVTKKRGHRKQKKSGLKTYSTTPPAKKTHWKNTSAYRSSAQAYGSLVL